MDSVSIDGAEALAGRVAQRVAAIDGVECVVLGVVGRDTPALTRSVLEVRALVEDTRAPCAD